MAFDPAEQGSGVARTRIVRALSWRWPRERLLFTTGCRVDRLPGRFEYILGVLGRMHCLGASCVNDPVYRDREAVLGITKARLIYQTRGRQGMLLRGAAAGLGALAALVLSLGHVAGFVLLLACAGAMWFCARIAESFGMGSGCIEFHRIRRLDRREQRIEGVGQWGTVYRLRIPDESDFQMIAAVVAAGPSASAA
jgi:hypothetical protein